MIEDDELVRVGNDEETTVTSRQESSELVLGLRKQFLRFDLI